MGSMDRTQFSSNIGRKFNFTHTMEEKTVFIHSELYVVLANLDRKTIYLNLIKRPTIWNGGNKGVLL